MLSVLKVNGNVSFCRALTPGYEENDYSGQIKAAKKYLGISNLTLIQHGPSFPVSNGDLFIGSPFSKEAAEFNKFAKMHGYDSIQLGPPGLPSPENPSPYASSVYSKNYLFADMPKLTTDKYANILDVEDIKKESSLIYQENSTMTNYRRAFKAYDRLFEKAYDKLMSKNDTTAVGLKSEFETFKNSSQRNFETDALFSILEKKYKTPDFEKWSPFHQNLIQYVDDVKDPNHKKALSEYKSLLLDGNNTKSIDLYKFKQFIVDRHEREFINENPEKLNYISDALVGFSPRDVWANKGVFLPNYHFGCPYGGQGMPEGQGTPRGANQIWGDVPVIDPKALFNKDGSLGKGGLLIKQKYGKMLDTYQNIRIDYVLGLVDPWVYDKNNVQIIRNDKGEVIHTNANGANISQFGKKNVYPIENWMDENTKNIYKSINEHIAGLPDIDPDRNYSKVIEKIILPMIKEKGLNPNDLVWEDLCTPTSSFSEIYKKKFDLPSIIDLKGAKGENQPRRNWFLISSHDTPPFAKVANDRYFYENLHQGKAMQPDYLIGFLHPEKSNVEKDKIIGDLYWDTRTRVITKYQELLRCGEKIQVSFMDFFGLEKTYNKAGTVDKDNWRLRLSKNYKENYYKTLENKDWRKIALNIPEILERAVTSLATHNGELDKMKPLIDNLKHYKEVLYSPEEVAKAVTKIAQKAC